MIRSAGAAVVFCIGACADEPPPDFAPLMIPILAAAAPEATPPDADAQWGALTVLKWPATVMHASRVDAAGPCFVEALTDGLRFRRVVVVCGVQVLFDSDDARYGGPVEGATLRERAESDQLVYAVQVEHENADVRLSLDTREEIAKLEQSSLLGWSLQLSVEPWTERRNEPALLLPPVEQRASSVYLRVGDEPGPLEPNTTCEIAATVTEAAGAELECAFRVVCGEREVIGSATPGSCELRDGSLVALSIESEDRAPTLVWRKGEENASIVVDGRRVGLLGNGGAIGVPECDAYLNVMRGCLPSMPEATQRAMEDALGRMEEVWKEAAGGPGRDALDQACRAATEASETTRESFGCGA